MPSGKIRPTSSDYSNFGGINVKASQYLTGPQEFLDLINFDFQSPGNLTKRWGTTQYQPVSYTGSITGLAELEQTSGFSQVVFSYSGGIQAGATTGALQGLSFSNVVWTGVFILGPHDVQFTGATTTILRNPIAFSARLTFFRDNSFYFSPGLFYAEPASLDGNPYDFLNYNNSLWGANGSNFIKYQGTTTARAYLPPPTRLGASSPSNTSMGITSGLSLVGASGLFLDNSYGYNFAGAFLAGNGYESEAAPIIYSPQLLGASALVVFGSSQINYNLGIAVNVPLNFGITAINVYGARTTAASASVFGSTAWDQAQDFRFLYTYPIPLGATSAFIYLGQPLGSTFGWENGDLLGINQKFTFGMTTYIPNTLGSSNFSPGLSFLGPTFGDLLQNGLVYHANISPKFVEISNNRMFSAGYSAAPSSVYFSEVGMPDDVEAENFFEVRSNDGDVITALQNYNQNLYIFKKNSFSVLSGTDLTNFVLREVADQYGCLANRAVVTYENHMVFLDQKGLMRYNGANIECISDKLQPVFDTMNVTAAQQTATMVHDKQRNQILLGLPVNGSTLNNLTVVYDYSVNGLTKYDGYNPSVFAMVKGRQPFKTAMFGGYSGLVQNFSPSLLADNGSAFTCLLSTRFLTEEGNNIQKMWRRLFLNDTTNGTTIGYTVNFKQDHGTSFVLSRSLSFNAFQTRMDFGIQAKSLAFELTNRSSDYIQVNGFVLEHRFLRNV